MTDVGMSAKQLRSIAEAEGRVNIWDGSVRSGKTIASILRWFIFLANPPSGALVMIGRTRDSLARNVLDVMADENLFGNFAQYVKYTPGAPFAMVMGRKIHVFGASDNQSEKTLRGLTVAGAYVDEITVCLPDVFRQLLARMSVDGAMMFGTTNPDSPSHWLKAEFLDRVGTTLKDWRTWHFILDDNPQLSEAYKDSLKAEYTGLWYRRFILGHWVSAEGAVFDLWDQAQHVVPWGHLPMMRELVAIGVDYGTTNPTVAVLVGLGEDNIVYAIDEWDHEAKETEQRWTDRQLSLGLRRWHRQKHLPVHPSERFNVEVPCDTVIVDPAAASFRVQLQQDGLHTYAADNDVLYGIKLIASLLSRGRLKVSDRCTRLIKEIPGYSWSSKATEDGVDRPIKEADHAIDALRYALVSTEGRWRYTIDSTAVEPNQRIA